MSQYIKPPKSADLQWKTGGFPPEPGWYPCSVKCDPEVLRYHFGDGVWSSGFSPDTGAEFFDLLGELKPADPQPQGLMWADPWWPASSDEPVSDEPVSDEPVSDEPVSDEPQIDEPQIDEPQIDLFKDVEGPGNEVG